MVASGPPGPIWPPRLPPLEPIRGLGPGHADNVEARYPDVNVPEPFQCFDRIAVRLLEAASFGRDLLDGHWDVLDVVQKISM